ncbi:MAG TPA: NTP transferase domain-containing protein [Kofleriaceae bacterium]
MSSEICVFIQARMSSRRFPGKVLAPFRGRPIIWHVIERVRHALPELPCVVVTSTDATDDPLAAYVGSLDVAVYRGALDDVLARFAGAAAQHPAAWLLRICADSPVLDERVLKEVVAAPRDGMDLVTTTAPRTWPKGHNAELIRTSSLMALLATELDAEDREHVTRAFHRQTDRYKLTNVESGDPSLAGQDLAVDTLEDLRRLEAMGWR